VDNLPGEAKITTHKDWIEVLSMSFGVKNTASVGLGGITSGKSQAGELELTKYVDSSSPALFLKCAMGEPASELKLEFERLGGGGTPVVTYRVTLNNVIVTKVEADASDGEVLTETVSFAYQKIKVEYYKLDAKGSVSGQPTTVNWDFAGNTK